MTSFTIPKPLVIFNRTVSNRKMVLIFLILFAVASIALSIYKKDFNWLAAFGGVCSVFGVLLTVSHSVPKNETEMQQYLEQLYPEKRDGILNWEDPNEEKIEQLRIEKASNILKSESLGLIITVIGTLLWAYSGFITQAVWG